MKALAALTVAGMTACTAPPAFDAWARAGFNGAIVISTAGRFDYQAGNTVDTVYSIGSVSKAFTAAAIHELAGDGKLSLDDPVGRLVPAITGPVRGATVRQLLRHTSGIAGSIGDDDQPLDRAGAIAALNKLELSFPPGTDTAYSNAGYTLLALVIDTVSGMSYREYTRQHGAGGFWPGSSWVTDGNGSLAMTPRELARWTYEQFRAAPSSTPDAWTALDDYGTPVLAVAGGGGDVDHNVAAVWIPARKQVIVVASDQSEITAEELLAATLPSLAAGKPLPTPSPPPAGDPAAVAGTYRLETGGSFEVTVDGNRSRVAAVGADAVAALFPPSGHFSADDMRAHEKRVREMLSGRTREGRAEREAVEAGHGPITRIDDGGTVVAEGEMRTYVVVTTRDGPRLGWYAVDEHSSIQGAELPTEPPHRTLPDAALDFTDGRLTVSGPDRAVTARRE